VDPALVNRRTYPDRSRTRLDGSGRASERLTSRLPRFKRSRTARVYAQRWRVEVTLGAVAMVVAATVLTAWPAASPPRRAPDGISLTRSGLVMADPFDHPVAQGQLMDHYGFNGSAAPGVGWARATEGGLQVGVRAHTGWAGWFAVTLHAAGPGVVWHVQMSRPRRPLSVGRGEAVFAVQTATTQHTGAINYVVVSALSMHGEGEWLVGYAHGVVADADTEVLWRSPLRADAASSEPVTIRTDGRRRLVVWLGNRLVYSSDRLGLDIPPPFQAYLEVQGQGTAYTATFQDFWVTDTGPVTVTGAPPGTGLQLSNGGSAVAAIAGRDGAATLSPPLPTLVGTATLTVVDKSGSRHVTGVPYAGGDIWHLAGS
jgi:hypothetical protein